MIIVTSIVRMMLDPNATILSGNTNGKSNIEYSVYVVINSLSPLLSVNYKLAGIF
jgi:hypothetical protein